MARMLFTVAMAVTTLASAAFANAPHFVHLKALNKYDRTKIVEMGVSIEALATDSVYGLASDSVLERLKKSDIKIMETFLAKPPEGVTDFPSEDSRFHNYDRMTKALDDLVAAHGDIMRKFSIGKTLQGREMWAVQVNTGKETLNAKDGAVSVKPGIVFMGNHHAREHVSAEIPLMLLEYLAKNYGVDKDITALLDKRDIYVIPMVNADGVEFDISTGEYKYQRKNMRPNGSGHIGVDLNRNYGFKWGTGGSSTDPSSDVYMGPNAFSEPETQNIKAFVEGHPNLKVLLTFHTFSELILYPWGHKYDAVENKEDLATFEVMGKKMAEWNKYTPEQSSGLYIASGDTVDWAYGSLGIFAFTFELSPKEMYDGGFYPGAGVLDKVFEDNLRPALYLIDLADNPHRAKSQTAGDFEWLH
ncbi:MAG: zinc carboxypeptidase [Deltaproteobacteria bacterium]|nr:zinc carboxypeptidase [Deltaproteobacteria bacterium]